MKRYFSGLFIAVAMLAAGCTDVDDTLGQEFIPDSQQMELGIGTVVPFDGFIALNDSVPASGQGVIFIGSMENEVLGGTRATAMTDFYPLTTDWNEGRFFGFEPVIDSVYLQFTIQRISGKSSVEQNFNIYAMRDSIKRDSVYRMGTPDLASKVDFDKPLFSFMLKDDIPVGSEAVMKIEPTEHGRAFLQRLIDVPQEVYKNPWPKFHKEFYGLYFAPAPGEETDAALYELSINNNTGGLITFFHNHDREDPEQNVDTAFVVYDFRSVSWYIDNRVVNTHVNSIEYTYPAGVEERLEDFDIPLDNKIYVQSLGGVISCLKVTDELLEWFGQAKGEHADMVIHNAQLDIPLVQPNTMAEIWGIESQPRELLPMRLGMYYYYGKGTPIPDYDYAAENSSYSNVTLPYGGYFYTAEGGYYRMDVTEWLTKLMLDPENTPQEIWLGPEINTRANTYTQAALDTDRIRMVVTYTLIQ